MRELVIREPGADAAVFGLLAEFDGPERLVEAAQQARGAGYRSLDAYSPFPVEGIAEALGFRDNRVGWLTLIGGVLGAAFGFGIQVYTRFDYPIDVGGRTLFSYEAFLLVAFLTTILFAAFIGIGGMFVLDHLPRLHHPVFAAPHFGLTNPPRFFLIVFSNDAMFEERRTRAFLEGLAPRRVEIAPGVEAPE